jgi:predicted acetyltransferase
MRIVIASCSKPEDVLQALAPISHYFGSSPTEKDAPRFVPFIEPSRAITAREGDSLVAGCASFPFELTVPGGTVRAAGLTIVGVLPTHRRRGILRKMMRAHLDDVRRRGEPVGILWASEDVIYGQFGYGQASFCGETELPKHAADFARPVEPEGEFRILAADQAAAPMMEVYERVRPDFPGMLSSGSGSRPSM